MTRFWARAYGVIRRPRATFPAIVADPAWGPALLATTLVTFTCSAGFLQTEVGRQALVDQWERTASAFGQTVDDAAYSRMEERTMSAGFRMAYAGATTLVGGPAAALLLAGILFVVLNRRTTGTATFRQVLAVVSYSGVVLALRQVIATPIDYVRESIASPTTLLQFFGMFDEASPAARFLGAIDLLVVWWLFVLAVGVSILYRRRSILRLTMVFAGAYMAIAFVIALTMAISGGTT